MHVALRTRGGHHEGMSITTVIDADGDAPPAILYLPEGTHDITASVNGEGRAVRIVVTPDCVPLLQADLDAKLVDFRAGKAARPVCLFKHDADGPASFLPASFSWEPGKGVLCHGDEGGGWTNSGRLAVVGRDYGYFSPRIAVDRASHEVVGLLPGVEIGSLTNNPAFDSIERIAASKNGNLAHADEVEESEKQAENTDHEREQSKPDEPKHTMDIKKLLGLPEDADDAAVQAALDDLKKKAARTDELEASNKSLTDDKTKVEEEKKKAEEEKKKALDEAACAKKAAAEQLAAMKEGLIADAISCGKIAPKDEAAKKAIGALFDVDPANARAVIAAMRPDPAFETVTASKKDSSAPSSNFSAVDYYNDLTQKA